MIKTWWVSSRWAAADDEVGIGSPRRVLSTPLQPPPTQLLRPAAADSSESFTLKEDHKVSMLETTSHVSKNLKECRNRSEEFMDLLKEHYREYYNKSVFELKPEMKADATRHYYKATRNFRYLLIAETMMAWLSHGCVGHVGTVWRSNAGDGCPEVKQASETHPSHHRRKHRHHCLDWEGSCIYSPNAALIHQLWRYQWWWLGSKKLQTT